MSDVAAAVPPPRDGSPVGSAGADSSSAEVLRGLGLDALVRIVESSAYGVCVTGADHTWLYLNPAGAALMGSTFDELRGRDYLLQFAPHEREALLGLEADQRDGDRTFYTNTVVRPDGTERQMTWSGTVVSVDGEELAPAFFHDTTDVRRAAREADLLAAASAGLASGGDTDDVVAALTRAAVETTRACGAVVLVQERHGDLLDRLPGWGLVREGRVAHVARVRQALLAGAGAGPGPAETACLAAPGWDGASLLPVRREGEVVGVLLVLLPSALRSPSETEVAFWSSLADQVSAALAEQRLRERTRVSAVQEERRRLGRDLHDSVSQQLFVLRQRAELVERALARGDLDLARRAADGLGQVSTQAIADVRALLDELRPAVVEGLADAVHAVAGRTSAQHGLPVHVAAAGDLAGCLVGLPATTTEHLVMVVGEALHNVVKHARASAATVTLAVEGRGPVRRLVVEVCDDGVGLDPTAAGSGHGRRTMAERALLCGGELQVVGEPGRGTRVVVRVPLPV